MPNPKQGEPKSDFISRCMSADDMQKYDQDQRLAICHSKFEKGVNMNPVMKSIQTINKNLNYVRKAQEGDKRTIFGKPSTFSGGEWHADEGGTAQDTAEATEFGQGQDEVDQFNQNMEQALAKLSPEERAKAEQRMGLKPSGEKFPGEEGIDPSDIDIEDFDDTFGGIDPENIEFDELQSYIDNNEIDMSVQEFIFELNRQKEEIRSELGDNEMEASSNDNPVQKSLNTIHKNLAGVHDALQRNGVTSTNDDHSHSYLIDRDGNGATTGMVGESSVQHIHEISNYEVAEAQNHTHYI